MNDAARLLRHGNRLLLLLLVCLKLTGGLAWPWIAVLAPAWGPFLLGATVAIPLVLSRGHRPRPAPLAPPAPDFVPDVMTVRQSFAARPAARLR